MRRSPGVRRGACAPGGPLWPAALLALALAPAAARATVREEVFEVVLASPPARAGGVIRGELLVRASRPVSKAVSLRVGERGRAIPVTVVGNGLLAEGIRVPFEVPEDEAGEAVRFEVEGGGASVRRWIDLARFDEAGRVIPGPLVPADGVAVPEGAAGHSVPEPLPDEGPRSASVGKAPGDAVQATIRVKGRLVYLREDGATVGADGATVRIYDDDGLFDGLLASGTTNSKGEYDLSFDWSPCLLCDQKPDLYARFESGNAKISVEIAGSLTRYSWLTGVVPNFDGALLDFGTVRPGVERDAPALHVLTVANRAWRWYRDKAGFDLPPVAYTWPWYGPGTFYTVTPFGGRMFVQPARQWHDDTICHEYGHHFVNAEGYSEPPSYCNGLCDEEGDFPIEVDQLCGHCLWCPETGGVAWSEGLPNFLAHVQTSSFGQDYGLASLRTRDQEYLGVCGDGGDPSPATTEGFLGALLQDIWDAERDTVVQVPAQGSWWDRLALGYDEIITVAALDEPRSALDFIAKFAARYPQHRDSLWETAEHNGFVQDVIAPPAPTGLTSPSHPTMAIYDDPTVRLRWDPVTDDYSGIDHYKIVIESVGPLYPIHRTMEVRGTEAAVPYVSGGTRVARVSAVDRAGNEGPAAEYAPILVGFGAICDLQPYALPGWPYPIQPSKVCGGTVPVLPDTLQGGTPTTCLWYGSINVGATNGSARAAAYVDDRLLTAEPSRSYLPGEVEFHYPPLLVVPGGRHTLAMKVDDLETAVEADELNNAWGRQWVWTPTRLRQDLPVVRPVAGPRTGGWEDSPFVPLYFNADGLRFETTGEWTAVHVRPVDGAAEIDCRLHFATQSADSGFAVVRGLSQRPGRLLDAVLVNRRVAPAGWYDVGVVTANDSAGTYEAKQVVSTPQPGGQDFWLQFGLDDRMLLAEIDIPPFVVGPLSIDLEVEEGYPPLNVAWFDRTFARGGLLDAVAMTTVPGGPVPTRLDVTATGPGRHLIAVWRDEAEYEYGIRIHVRESIPDLAVFEPAGWHAPFVPSAVARQASSVPAPDTLIGNAAGTYWNIALRNDSGIAAPVTSGGILVDGFERYVLSYPAVPANGTMLTNYDFGQTVVGGRHTVGYVADSPSLVEELLEDNNRYGEQYVWSPQELALVTLAYRTQPPPDPVGGFDDVTTGEAFHYNSDGWRTPPFASRFGRWGAVVVTPEDDGDVDLRLHELGPGAKDGLREALAVSAWGPGQTDYVIIDFNRTPFRRFDVGVIRGFGSAPGYWMLSMQSSSHAVGSGLLGPYALGADRMLRLHEFYLPAAGVYPLRIENQNAGIDLGVTVHGGRAFASKSDGVGGGNWLADRAQTSTFNVQVDSAGWYCVAVWRTGASQRAGTAQFRIEMASPSVDVEPPPPPLATSFAAPRPNPARGQVRFAFDLAREGEVRIEVFDVAGARVRTVAAGRQPAGRHELRWDARDEGGRALPPGLYLTRFEGGGFSATRRVVLIQ